MNFPFWKMHGASNDFVLVDDRAQTFPSADAAWIASIGERHTGVGCEGVILIQPSRTADFRMRFFNPDGSEVDMCGNGARCVARLAAEIGAAPQNMTIETVAGLLTAAVHADRVRLGMTEPKDWRIDQNLRVEGKTLPYHFVNSGVPHAVFFPEDLDRCEVQTLGRAVRYHAAFAPAGTNANFVRVTGPDAIRVRTYERGVEAETPACGTGIVASALIAARTGQVTAPVRVTAASGDVLVVDFQSVPAGMTNVSLEGPAVHVFQGVLAYKTPAPR